MSGEYYTIITSAFAARLAAHAAGGAITHLTSFSLGDGNGVSVSPTPAQTDLVRQIYPAVGRAEVVSAIVDPETPQQILVTVFVPDTAGPFVIREIGIFDDTGVLMAVAKTNEVKPAPTSGQLNELELTVAIRVSDIAAVTVIPSNRMLADRAYVDAKFNSVVIPFATLEEHLAGELTNRATNPHGVKAMIDAALTWFADQLPSFATTAEHLSGLLNNRWCHPAGVKAMIAEALGLTANLPLQWNAATRTMSLRAATDAVTGFGRVATDTEASSGITNALAGYQAPWVKPEQMAAKFANYVPPQPAVMGIGFATIGVTSAGALALDTLIAGPLLTRNDFVPSVTLPANTVWRVESFVGRYVDGLWYGEGVSGGTTNFVYMVRRVS